MELSSIPVLQASSVVGAYETTFKTFDGEVIVNAPAAVIRKVLSLCDGRKNTFTVLDEASKEWDKDCVQGLLEDLFRERIIVDGRNLIEDFWRIVTNPMLFPVSVSDEEVVAFMNEAVARQRAEVALETHRPDPGFLELLITRRKSTRVFTGESIPLRAIVGMLWSAYGECATEDGYSHRTVPSAGALYPLMIHVGLFQQTENLERGIYRACYDQAGSVGFKLVANDILKFARAFLNPVGIQKGVHGVIVISGSFMASHKKYGNRSLLYVTLEAGHAAQNILLSATQQNVATLEIGGFVDELVADSINLPVGYNPLVLIAFGKEEKRSVPESKKTLETDWAIPLTSNYKPGFALASVRLSQDRSWAHGRDPSPKIALQKATSEAREWTSCGCIPALTFARYGELGGAIDPRRIIQFDPAQYRMKDFPFAPFDEAAVYAWTKGHDMNGKEFFILADHVYFPYFPATPYYCYSNSSGCAAHSDEQKAIEAGTLELIERDAFMNAYLCRLDMPIIAPETLPDKIKKRLQQLRSIGFKVWLVDHSLDLAPVVFVFAQNEDLTFTVCASCSSFDIEYAIDHALTEAEASVLYRLQHGPLKAIKPRNIIWPNDHGRLYGQKEYFRKADFLVASERAVSFCGVGGSAVKSWNALLKKFMDEGLQHLIVPLTLSADYGGNNGLHIVRVIVPGLVPMTFGYRQEPAGMHRIFKISKIFENEKMSYGMLTKFPHPFE